MAYLGRSRINLPETNRRHYGTTFASTSARVIMTKKRDNVICQLAHMSVCLCEQRLERDYEYRID